MLALRSRIRTGPTITSTIEIAGMQDEIWHQFDIQNYNGNVLSVYSVVNITGNITEAGKGGGGFPSTQHLHLSQ